MVDKVSNHGFRVALMKIMNDDHKPFTYPFSRVEQHHPKAHVANGLLT